MLHIILKSNILTYKKDKISSTYSENLVDFIIIRLNINYTTKIPLFPPALHGTNFNAFSTPNT